MKQPNADLERQQKSFRGNRAHLRRLIDALRGSSAKAWNDWRRSHPTVRPDLRGLDLTLGDISQIHLSDLNLSSARLSGAQLTGLHAWDVQLNDADLRWANLDRADLSYGHLRRANLESCRLVQANLTLLNAEGAIFRHANLSHAVMNGAYLQGADLTGAKVAGLSTWDVHLDTDTKQDGLILEEVGDFLEDLVDSKDEGIKHRVIGRLDHIEAAQLLYLIKDKRKLKTVIDAMTAALVLLLGNFTSRRMSVLRSIEDKLADLGYAPVIFNFDAPADRDLIETVALLAGLSCFLIVDLTQPKSTPLETMLVAPQLGVPLASIIQEGKGPPFSMFRSLQAKYEWVLPTWTYRNKNHLVRQLKTAIVDPCEEMRAKLRIQRQAAVSPPAKRKRYSGDPRALRRKT
jgi:uncharacterized protein YjbI with pentapeptide repeats